jgi:ribokinase
MIIPMKVTGLGQCSLDHIFIVDSYPEPDTKKEMLQWTVAGGGPVATALVSLSRLGVSCRFCGIIGDDEAGEKISSSLKSENINLSGLIKRIDSTSQMAFIAVEESSGKRTIFWQRPSAKPLSPDEIPGDFLEDCDFLLVDGLMTEASMYAAKIAKKRNIPVMLDAGRVRDGMIELAHICDYVVASEEFAREFAGNDEDFNPENALDKMKSFGAKAATVTLGSDGSITVCKNEVFRTPAFAVDIVDTTGAGDVFHGGYIYGLLQRWDIRKVVRFASAFAALKCRKPGGRAGIPGLEEVEHLIESSAPDKLGKRKD